MITRPIYFYFIKIEKRGIQNYCASLGFSSAGPKTRYGWIPRWPCLWFKPLWPCKARPSPVGLAPQPCSLSWALSYHIVLPLARWPGERRFLSLEAESDLSFRIPLSILCSHHCLLNSFLVSFSQNSLGNPEGKPLKNFALVLCPEASVTVCKHISAGEPFPSCGLPRREP